MQMFPKRIEQRCPRIDLELVILPVDLELKRCGGSTRASRWRRIGLLRLHRSDSQQGRTQRDRRTRSRDLLQKAPTRFRAAENQELIQLAGGIDRRQRF